jgi:hypothetical protein
MIPLVRQVMRQTRERIFCRNTRAENKLFSVFEPSTEIIRKGKASKPNEFGKMVKLQEAENQIVIDYEVYDRRPSDSDFYWSRPSKSTKPNSVARHVWSRQMPRSTPPGMKPPRRQAASNVFASPVALPRDINWPFRSSRRAELPTRDLTVLQNNRAVGGADRFGPMRNDDPEPGLHLRWLIGSIRRECGSHHCPGRGTSTADSKILRELLQRDANALGLG